LVVACTSWFNAYTITRTLSNTVEAVFSAVAFYYWTLGKLRSALVLAAVACLLRPTNGVLWMFLGVMRLQQVDWRTRMRISFQALWIGLLAVGGMVAIDSWYYGKWTFVPYTFLHVNLVRGISLFYGSHPWHWYLVQAIPAIFATFLPLLALGVYQVTCLQRLAFYASVWLVGVYSMLAHKEFRFLYPIVPLLLPYCGVGAASLFKSRRILLRGLVFVPQILMGIYFGGVHQRGAVKVMQWLDTIQPQSVGFLMPCHSTPYWSELSTQVPMWFITCEPPPMGADPTTYTDESTHFYASPSTFLSNHLSDKVSIVDTAMTHKPKWWPSHVVLFEALLDHEGVATLLTQRHYVECARFFNSHFHDDARRHGDILVYCK
jgi:phosphatidylinositol glycan class B